MPLYKDGTIPLKVQGLTTDDSFLVDGVIHCQTLGVPVLLSSRGEDVALWKDIKEARRTKVLEFHPDKSASSDVAVTEVKRDAFNKIMHSYEQLRRLRDSEYSFSQQSVVKNSACNGNLDLDVILAQKRQELKEKCAVAAEVMRIYKEEEAAFARKRAIRLEEEQKAAEAKRKAVEEKRKAAEAKQKAKEEKQKAAEEKQKAAEAKQEAEKITRCNALLGKALDVEAIFAEYKEMDQLIAGVNSSLFIDWYTKQRCRKIFWHYVHLYNERVIMINEVRALVLPEPSDFEAIAAKCRQILSLSQQITKLVNDTKQLIRETRVSGRKPTSNAVRRTTKMKRASATAMSSSLLLGAIGSVSRSRLRSDKHHLMLPPVFNHVFGALVVIGIAGIVCTLAMPPVLGVVFPLGAMLAALATSLFILGCGLSGLLAMAVLNGYGSTDGAGLKDDGVSLLPAEESGEVPASFKPGIV